MGTRGFVGFVVDDEVKIQYQQYDSYPEGVGADVLAFARISCVDPAAREVTRRKVRAIRLVKEDDGPTENERVLYAQLADPGVSTGQDWYSLLRKQQGALGAPLDSGIMLDAMPFPADSLFCEWGYLVNLDLDTFEVYRGFQQEPHDNGRFAKMGRDGDADYYPVALVRSWPLDQLPGKDEFVAAFAEDEQ